MPPILRSPARRRLLGLLAGLLGLGLAACGPSPLANPATTVTPYQGELTANQQTAQALALGHPDLAAQVKDRASGQPLRAEVFGVYPARPSDLAAGAPACPAPDCYRVDIYNYATNTTISVVVDVRQRQAVQFNALVGVQPEVPPYLVDKAVQLAAAAPEVKAALGFDPAGVPAVMANVKTSLKGTACELSRHLCVAPTFIVEGRGLWAIVDLTDARLVGVRWTDMGTAQGGFVSEEELTYSTITAQYCEKTNHLAQDGWEFDYILTSSDGVELTQVRFNGRPVLDNVKLVDWHVSYSQSQQFGYSDAIGCPLFSSASVLASGGPTVTALTQDQAPVGFSFLQDFRNPSWPEPCNYRYQQRFDFYRDGRFRVLAINLGHGCGNNGTYRPVLRLQFPAGQPQTFAAWDGAQWQTWPAEQWQLQSQTLAPDGAQFRLTAADGAGYDLVPGNGTLGDDAVPDNAWIYVTRYHPEEGEADLLTLGACCNTDYRQGPEQFIGAQPEALTDSPLVVWYVPQLMLTDAPGRQYCWADTQVEAGLYVPVTYPCQAGPLFIPFQP